jgi:two-component system chemotaxis response regulator CheB
MNGIEAIERIMSAHPTPIVVYSSFVDGVDRANASSAFAAGAVDVMAKPGPDDSGHLEEYADALRQRLRVAGRVKVITHPRRKLGLPGAGLTTLRLGPGPGESRSTAPKHPASVTVPSAAPLDDKRQVDLLAIGASTGGPQALATLLTGLPAATNAPIVVVQHMANGFMEGLAHWLDDICPLPVALAEHGRRLVPGTVTVAPSGLNLIVHPRLRVTIHPPEAGQFHVPGIDATFASVAESYGAAAVGVLLTGMGRDGAAGLKQMRDHGGLTIGQDESTSAVYGMPAAAMSADAVDLQLPLPEICSTVYQLLGAAPAATGVGGAP